MKRLKFKHYPQASRVVNGCGAKGGWLDPPEFLFHASCNEHDFNYWVGGTEADRKYADRGFYRAMSVDIKRECDRVGGFWQRLRARTVYRGLAWSYYRSVRSFGRPYFHYGEPRALKDLLEAATR